MELLRDALDIFLHLDTHLQEVISHYGAWTYAILATIIFCETGLVVTPFLPGDSLLFAAGTFAAQGSLDIGVLIGLLATAAIVGDNLNYWVGRTLAPRVVRGDKIRFVKQAHLDRTHAFFEKYGARTIILARFVPIVRTFAPFVAGVGAMSYGRFLAYDIAGGFIWVGSCSLAGYLFGNIPVVRDHFTLVVLAIIFVSLLPAIVEIVRYRAALRRAKAP